MLMFNGILKCSKCGSPNLNTSYVNVQLELDKVRNFRYGNLNTSYVNVQLFS